MIVELLITSTVLILVIFFLRKLTMGKISMRLRYALWLLVAVRLLVPASVGTSALSVMNLLPAGEPDQTVFDESSVGTEPAEGKTKAGIMTDAAKNAASEERFSEKSAAVTAKAGEIQGDNSAAAKKNGTVSRPAGFSLYGVLRVVWFLGFVAAGGYMIISEWRFSRYLRKNRNPFPDEKIPPEFAGRLSRRGMKVYQVKGLPGPCLAGRYIYIGEGTAVQEQSLAHILAHEYCHARHGDGLWAFLRCALAAVYWFDPFVWAAAYAARKDSELACDEAAVELLGESRRFAYGRTLLALLESGGRETCPGMTFMTQGGEGSVRERIFAIAEKGRTKGSVLAAVLTAVVLVCGCAFTGADRESVNLEKETGEQDAAGKDGNGQGEKASAAVSDGRNRQTVIEDDNAEFDRIQKEYEENVKNGELTEEQIEELEKSALREADQAAFEEILNYHGVMEGQDDSGLSLDRRADVQHFYEYFNGKQETAPETGWYLLCRAEEESISVYGLFTEEFGCRGMKLLVGEDVNTFDRVWYPSHMNESSDNIHVTERAEDGMPRRFVWKYMEEENSVIEKWRLAGGYRYDTGTVDAVFLSEQDYLSWADWHLTYGIDPDRRQVRVYYDGDENALAGVLDISGYESFSVEEVRISPKTVSFELDSDLFEEGGMIIHLAPGLQFEGADGLWNNGLHPIAVQVLWKEDGTGFRFGKPKVDERYVLRCPAQEWDMEALLEEKAEAGQTGGGGESRLSEPLVNAVEGHHDLEISFRNPCPDYERISDAYGERVHPATGKSKAHNGVDLAASEGADVLAAAEGTVYETGFDAEYGNYVALWHGQSGQMTYYTHCKEVVVSEGEQVEAGKKIATVGKTGRATGSVLHFAVSYEGKWQEPVWG